MYKKVLGRTTKDDLDKMVKWSEKWQMLFNFGKCKCIHIGHGNMDEEYKMGDAVLGRTTQEKVLGVTFSVDMKVSEQCGISASIGSQILWLIREIRRNITYKEKKLIVYSSFVFPCPVCMHLHFPKLNNICHFSNHLTNLSRSSCKLCLSVSLVTFLNTVVSSTNVSTLLDMSSSKIILIY